ncbi:unnamed protein product [Nippostrongylus brasiliensis]|uniref:DUF4338 domain-containing protein n=1 Tax=Nippostrongylus brasiliensis TaxID=27835 RepID=A0A0N4XWV3_NIPBR|nr:unnamed protein product [Nippostrongylus brasiliensis]
MRLFVVGDFRADAKLRTSYALVRLAIKSDECLVAAGRVLAEADRAKVFYGCARWARLARYLPQPGFIENLWCYRSPFRMEFRVSRMEYFQESVTHQEFNETGH